jgi:hypothetical protein
MQQAFDAFMHGKRATHEKQQQGRDHRPEVGDAMMAEGEAGASGTGRFLNARQQEQLVGAVCRGMDRLGQHRAGTCPERRYVLRHGNAEVAPSA